MSEKIDKTQVKGLPKGASLQSISNKIYVYFRYSYRLDGRTFQERDYLGTVENMTFIPNDYYIDHRPVKSKRPLRNWTNERKRKIEEEKLVGKKIKTSTSRFLVSDFAPEESYDLSVGATALIAQSLYDSGMVSDVVNTILEGDEKTAVDALNLAMHAAVTADPTYLASNESELQKFIGKACLTSQRASELHQKLGMKSDLSIRIGKARAKRLSKGDLLALDGTKIHSDSSGISLAKVGKRKDGTYGKQITFSMLFNASNGMAIGYRPFAGNEPDVKTLDDFMGLWKDFDIGQKEPVFIVDRGYYDNDRLIELHKVGVKFIVGAKTSLKYVQTAIDENNSSFFEARSYLRNRGCYQVHCPHELKNAQAKAPVELFMYRNPVSEMRETDALYNRLDKFEEQWLKGKVESDDSLLVFYKDPKQGSPLIRDNDQITAHCFMLGYFAFVSNYLTDPTKVLDNYSERNEVEIYFKKQMELFASTRVQSDETLQGLLFTTFIGASALTDIMWRMRRKAADDAELRTCYTVPELLKRLQKIRLVKTSQGDLILNNVTEKDKDLVAKLGFPGLFDSAESVAELLSVQKIKSVKI